MSRLRTVLASHSAFWFVQFNFSVFPVVGKMVLAHVHPMVLAGLRAGFGAPLLVLWAYLVDRYKVTKKDLLHLFILGMLGVASNQIMFIFGLQKTTALNAAVLMPSIPVFTAAMSVLAGVERLTAATAAGVLLAFGGAMVMADVGSLTWGEHMFGNVLLLLNCVCYSGYLVLQRPLLKRIPPLTLVAWSFVFGGTVVVLVSLPWLAAADWSLVPFEVTWYMMYIVMFPTVINYFLNAWALNKTSPTTSAVYTTLQPVMTSLIAFYLLGDAPTLRDLTGYLLILGGLAAVVGESVRRHRLKNLEDGHGAV